MKDRSRAFTLIETLLAVLLLAMLASAAAMTFSRPIAQARGEDAIEQLRSFDANTRAAAISSAKVTRITFDLSNNALERRDGPMLKDVRYAVHLPPGFRIDAVLIGGETTSQGETPLDISPMGLSRSYAVHLIGPATDQWLVVAGLSGEMKKMPDGISVQQLLSDETKTR